MSPVVARVLTLLARLKTRGSPDVSLDGPERNRIVSEYVELLSSRHSVHSRSRALTAVALIVMLSGLLPALAILTLQQLVRIGPSMAAVILALTAAAIVCAVLLILLASGLIGPRRRLWWVAMRTCGQDVCCSCGSWLKRRAPDSRACPECGTLDDQQLVPLESRGSPSHAP